MVTAVTGYIEQPDGSKRCPTEICNAVCCRATHYIPGLPGPCNHLVNNQCSLHGSGKPKGCDQYPRNQADIDMINKQAADAGFSERCLLQIAEV